MVSYPRAPERERLVKFYRKKLVVDVSIHAPPKGRDFNVICLSSVLGLFQSTRPRKGATYWRMNQPIQRYGFNPRAPERARRQRTTRPGRVVLVSIHAPPKGRDWCCIACRCRLHRFNPRAPERARLAARHHAGDDGGVSIHAPPKGRDGRTSLPRPAYESFNPRAPERARRSGDMAASCSSVFQSTRPRKGATTRTRRQTHKLECFNPRAPERARRPVQDGRRTSWNVSIHAPPKGRDPFRGYYNAPIFRFQSTRPRKGATR